MSSYTTAATARRITTAAKAAAPGVKLSTESQGPYSFRVVLHDTLLWGNTDITAGGLIAHAVRAMDEGGRFTATWGRARNGKIVINVTDETTRERLMEEQEARRAATLAAALEEVAAADPLRQAAVAQAEQEAAEEPVDMLACAACGLSADSPAHQHDHAYVIGDELGTAGTIRPAVEDLLADTDLTVRQAHPVFAYAAGTGTEEAAEAALGQLPVRQAGAILAAARRVRPLSEQAQATLAAPRELSHADRLAVATGHPAGSTRRAEGAPLHRAVMVAQALSGQGQLAGEFAAELSATEDHLAGLPRKRTAASLPCWHVTTAAGEVYGVAMTARRDAMQKVADRLSAEGSGDSPARAVQMGRWCAPYGTVLHY